MQFLRNKPKLRGLGLADQWALQFLLFFIFFNNTLDDCSQFTYLSVEGPQALLISGLCSSSFFLLCTEVISFLEGKP